MPNHKNTIIPLILLTTSVGAFAGELPSTFNLSGMQFNFSTPGARSLAMGGAFIGRADDATAAFANPAGLTSLFAPEISAEYRDFDFSTDFTTDGSYPSGLVTDTSSSSTSNLSFASYVKADFESDWVFSVFYHQLMDFETAYQSGTVVFPDFSNAISFQRDNSINVDIQSYGISTAYRVTDRLSVGGSLVFYDFSMNGGARFYDLDGSGNPTDDITDVLTHAGDDSSTGVTLGLTFAATEKLNIGFVYRSTPEFDAVHSVLLDGETSPLTRQFSFEVPNVYGVGFSYQPSDRLTINLDVNRVSYSDLTDPMIDGFLDLFEDDTVATRNLSIDDGTEVHLGLEYIVPRSNENSIALRAGIWSDPAHTIEYNGPTSNNVSEQFFDAFFREGDDETHTSIGIGFIFGTKGQIDIAADFSENQDTLSVSGVLRFN